MSNIVLRCANFETAPVDLIPDQTVDLRLEISAIENTSIGDVYGVTSQEFTIVGDNTSNQFFGNIFNLGATPAVALKDSIPCQVLQDGAEVFTGKMYVDKVITNQEGLTYYNVVVVNETVDFKFEQQDKYLAELDWSWADHPYTFGSITSSWDGALLNGSVIYPNVNYGTVEGDATSPLLAFSYVNINAGTFDNALTPLRLIDFKPAIRVKDVIDTIFSGSQYKYTSSFLNSPDFINLYTLVTPTDKLGAQNVSPISASLWAYRDSSPIIINPNTSPLINFNAKEYDNSNNFNLTTDRYTATYTGQYEFAAQIKYEISPYNPNIPTYLFLTVTKNNVSQVAKQLVQPPNTGFIYVNGITNMDVGDTLEVRISLEDATNTSSLIVDFGKNNSWFKIISPSVITLGGTVLLGQQFPPDLKVLDFIQGLIEKFNLIFEPVPNERNLIRIEPYQDWIDMGGVLDWTDKVDRSIKFEIKHPAIEQPKSILFADENDDASINQYQVNNFGIPFGDYEYVVDSNLSEGTRRIGKVFASTPVKGISGGNTFVIPHLCRKEPGEPERPFAFKPRLLYANGKKPVPVEASGYDPVTGTSGNRYFIKDEFGVTHPVSYWYQMTTFNSFVPDFKSTKDLHFNNRNFYQYFQTNVTNGKVENDAFTTYWANYLNSELYDIDSRKLTCNVFLKPSEIQGLALNSKIFIDGAYYRINKISGANLSRYDSVEVEFIKILNRQLKYPRRYVTSTTDDIRIVALTELNLNGSGKYTYDDGVEVTSSYELRQVTSKDNLTLFEDKVVWNYTPVVSFTNDVQQLGLNQISSDASRITVVGSSNIVEQANTVQILGDKNYVEQNTYNVSIMGLGNQVADLSNNVQILGGVENKISGSESTNIYGGSGSISWNNTFSTQINGQSDTLRDSAFTTAISTHENESIINGSGHTIIGLNKEQNGLDLLNYRPNSNYLGDTYSGGAVFADKTELVCGDGVTFDLGIPQYKHSNLFLLNWAGFSPGETIITLPSAVNNDYKNIIYTFVTNQTFVGGNGTLTKVLIEGISGQTINGQDSLVLKNPYTAITLTTSNGNWVTLDKGAPQNYCAFFSSASQALTTANTATAVTLNGGWEDYGFELSGSSKIVINNPGTYTLTAVMQVSNLSGSPQDAVFWLKFNNTDWPFSSKHTTLPARKSSSEPSAQVVNLSFVGTSLAAGDYVELFWAGTSTNLSLRNYVANHMLAGEPAAPSVSINISPVN